MLMPGTLTLDEGELRGRTSPVTLQLNDSRELWGP